jgi:hypothetical protein
MPAGELCTEPLPVRATSTLNSVAASAVEARSMLAIAAATTSKMDGRRRLLTPLRRSSRLHAYVHSLGNMRCTTGFSSAPLSDISVRSLNHEGRRRIGKIPQVVHAA